MFFFFQSFNDLYSFIVPRPNWQGYSLILWILKTASGSPTLWYLPQQVKTHSGVISAMVEKILDYWRWSTKAYMFGTIGWRSRGLIFFVKIKGRRTSVLSDQSEFFRFIEDSEQWSVREMTWAQTDSCLLKTSFSNAAWVCRCWWRKEVSRWLYYH
jgi:hypothetical protein